MTRTSLQTSCQVGLCSNLSAAYPKGALRLTPGSAPPSAATPAVVAVPASAATCGSIASAVGPDIPGAAGLLGCMSVAVWCAEAVLPQLRRHVSADLLQQSLACHRQRC